MSLGKTAGLTPADAWLVLSALAPLGMCLVPDDSGIENLVAVVDGEILVVSHAVDKETSAECVKRVSAWAARQPPGIRVEYEKEILEAIEKSREVGNG